MSELLAQLEPVVEAILRRKSGMSLSQDDGRRDNVEALDLCRDAVARIWEKLATDGAAVADPKGYAATITHNVWSDYIREKHPRRTSLKNRLRYFLGHQQKYAVWEGPDGEHFAGFRKWQYGTAAADDTRVRAVGEGRKVVAGRGKQMEQFAAQDWDDLLDRLFSEIGAPAGLDALTAAVSAQLQLKEAAMEAIESDEEDEPRREIADTSSIGPEESTSLRSALERLWKSIVGLRPDYRCAYLLNIPAPGKMRGDIEVFVLRGVARVRDIGKALALTAEQYETAFAELELGDDDRAGLKGAGDEHKFAVLWGHLPLPDALIGKLLGLEQQQVINRRNLAMKELRKQLGQ